MPALSDRLLMKLKSTSSRIQAGALLAPGLLIFCCFTIYPIVKLFLMSFTDWTLSSMVSQNFTGLSNYEEVFSDPVFFTTFANTLLYTLITVPGQMAAGLFVAYLINGIDRGSVFFRVINYLPVITSWVIASLVFRYCFNTEGLLNYFLVEKLGIADQNIRWLDQRWTALAVAMLLGIWKGVGWNMVVFLAALQQVPKELYEAADMDGCGYIRKFTKITLPEIRGTILFAWVMLTIGGFNVFTSIQLMTGGNPVHQTDTVLTWMYFKAFSLGEFGYASALSFVIALTLGILAVFQFRVMKNREAA